MIAAIFDIDGTLFPAKHSSDFLFFQYLFRKKILGLSALFRTFFHIIQNIPRGNDYMIKKNHAYLKNINKKKVEDLTEQFFSEEIRPLIKQSSYKLIKEHQSQGHYIILLSAALQPLVDLWKEEFEADEGIGTVVGVEGGNFTGEIVGEHPFGIGKKYWLEYIQKKYNLNFSRCYGYGDHFSDRFFLEQVGNPIAVKPDKKMRAYAIEKKWLITDSL